MQKTPPKTDFDIVRQTPSIPTPASPAPMGQFLAGAEPYVVITVQIPFRLKQQLKNTTHARNTTIKALLTDILDEYFMQHPS